MHNMLTYLRTRLIIMANYDRLTEAEAYAIAIKRAQEGQC